MNKLTSGQAHVAMAFARDYAAYRMAESNADDALVDFYGRRLLATADKLGLIFAHELTEVRLGVAAATKRIDYAEYKKDCV